jgi:Cu-Zn family superoxide dismutase
VEVENAPQTSLIVNIHQGTDCESPGGRWNPDGLDRSGWEEGVTHLGDIGQIKVGADGKGSVDVTTGRWTMGSGEANDVMGQTILVFDADESAGSEPLGCGVIKAG